MLLKSPESLKKGDPKSNKYYLNQFLRGGAGENEERDGPINGTLERINRSEFTAVLSSQRQARQQHAQQLLQMNGADDGSDDVLSAEQQEGPTELEGEILEAGEAVSKLEQQGCVVEAPEAPPNGGGLQSFSFAGLESELQMVMQQQREFLRKQKSRTMQVWGSYDNGGQPSLENKSYQT